jgi:benzoyl-CoA reductase/2-hydroxyglutaryl-CoA dehydratase subunit BcrC/BadD/HgdB
LSDHKALWSELGLDVKLHNELLESIDRNFRNTVGARQNRPAAMAYFDRVIHESHGGRVAELVAGRKDGRKIVGTFCIYVPDEIVMAVGMVPLPLCGGTNFSVPYAEKVFPRDICPLVKSTLGLAFSKTCPYAPIKSLAVGETTCDAKKKTWEFLAGRVNFHTMELPQKKDPVDVQLWRTAVNEFKDKVEALAGRKLDPGALAEAIRVMNEKRRALQRLAELRKADPAPISGLDALVVMQGALNDEPVRFTENVKRLNAELEQRVSTGASPFSKGTKRVMLSGCPAVMGNWKLHSLIEAAGAAIVHDETCTGSRYFEHLVDETARDLAGMLDALADRYLKINCACFTPNQDRIDGVVSKARDHKAEGVVEYVLQTCHGYNLEAIRVEAALKAAGIPNLKIVTDYAEEDTGQLRTRIEAFLEQLA